MSQSNIREFTSEEHNRFLEALERFGCTEEKSGDGDEWNQIASYVGGCTPEQVMAHATKYFLLLQHSSTADIGNVFTDNDNWTEEENLIFENELAKSSEGDSMRWERIAGLLNRSIDDVQEKYEHLVRSVLSMEVQAQQNFRSSLQAIEQSYSRVNLSQEFNYHTEPRAQQTEINRPSERKIN